MSSLVNQSIILFVWGEHCPREYQVPPNPKVLEPKCSRKKLFNVRDSIKL